MTRSLSVLLLLLCRCLVAGLPADAAPGAMAFRAGEVLVILEDAGDLTCSADGKAAAADAALAAAMDEHGLDQAAPLLQKTSGLNERDRRHVKLASSRAEFDPAAAAAALRATGRVRAASPNFLIPLHVLPNDPRLSEQWHIVSAGGAGVNLPAAWDIQQGAPGVVIAIMDTGVDTGHPDLAARIWQNPGEIPGNGLDDDGNGYVDDVRGWDFGQNDNDPNPHATPDPSGIDVGFHGTHCAGIAGAASDNGVGVAGATWGCSILPLKVVDGQGAFTTEALVGAFLYAADLGVGVLSMSFGGPDQDGFAAFVQQLVDEAITADVVCVAAAGNDGTSARMYPAACDGVIAVAATNSANARASFSNWGDWVDVAAPGERILSTMCRNYSFGWLMELMYMLLLGWDGTPYLVSDGTSMACPLVAGVCGLIRSAGPHLDAAGVARRLIDTGDPVAYDRPIGPKVNAAAAVSGLALSDAPPPPPAGPRLWPARPNPFNPRTTVAFTLAAGGAVRLAVHDVSGRLVRLLVGAELPPGEHRAAWDGRDDDGRAVAAGVYLARLTAEGVAESAKLVLVR